MIVSDLLGSVSMKLLIVGDVKPELVGCCVVF